MKRVNVADIEKLLGSEAARRLTEAITASRRNRKYRVEVYATFRADIEIEAPSEDTARFEAERRVIEDHQRSVANHEWPDHALLPVSAMPFVRSRITPKSNVAAKDVDWIAADERPRRSGFKGRREDEQMTMDILEAQGKGALPREENVRGTEWPKEIGRPKARLKKAKPA